MLPDNYRERFLETINQLLWRQWSNLGVPGTGYQHDCIVIDPEALLLFSTEFARYDPRLFDEILNWLNQNGKVINIQRLQNLSTLDKSERAKLGNMDVLAAISSILGGKSILRKWQNLKGTIKSILKDYGVAEKQTSLFLDSDGTAFPVPHDPDPNFLRYDLLRGPYKHREITTAFDPYTPSTLLIKLRYLFGVNARADVLCYLFTHKSAHPAEIARMTGYFKKTIQDCLNEMAQSNHVDSFENGREKHFCLRQDDWTFLQSRWTTEKNPRWLNHAKIFECIQRLWEMDAGYRKIPRDPDFLALDLRKIITEYKSDLSSAGFNKVFSDSASFLGQNFWNSLTDDLIKIYELSD